MENISVAVAILLLAYITGVFSVPDEMKEMMDMLHNTCVGETEVNEALITDAMKGNFADDPKLKCYMKCILIQTAAMDDDGVIDVEALAAMLPEDMKEEGGATMRKCGTKSGSDACDTAWLTNKCWYEDNPSKYFLI